MSQWPTGEELADAILDCLGKKCFDDQGCRLHRVNPGFWMFGSGLPLEGMLAYVIDMDDELIALKGLTIGTDNDDEVLIQVYRQDQGKVPYCMIPADPGPHPEHNDTRDGYGYPSSIHFMWWDAAKVDKSTVPRAGKSLCANLMETPAVWMNVAQMRTLALDEGWYPRAEAEVPVPGLKTTLGASVGALANRACPPFPWLTPPIAAPWIFGVPSIPDIHPGTIWIVDTSDPNHFVSSHDVTNVHEAASPCDFHVLDTIQHAETPKASLMEPLLFDEAGLTEALVTSSDDGDDVKHANVLPPTVRTTREPMLHGLTWAGWGNGGQDLESVDVDSSERERRRIAAEQYFTDGTDGDDWKEDAMIAELRLRIAYDRKRQARHRSSAASHLKTPVTMTQVDLCVVPPAMAKRRAQRAAYARKRRAAMKSGNLMTQQTVTPAPAVARTASVSAVGKKHGLQVAGRLTRKHRRLNTKPSESRETSARRSLQAVYDVALEASNGAEDVAAALMRTEEAKVLVEVHRVAPYAMKLLRQGFHSKASMIDSDFTTPVSSPHVPRPPAKPVSINAEMMKLLPPHTQNALILKHGRAHYE
jgi:hypothetical protein